MASLLGKHLGVATHEHLVINRERSPEHPVFRCAVSTIVLPALVLITSAASAPAQNSFLKARRYSASGRSRRSVPRIVGLILDTIRYGFGTGEIHPATLARPTDRALCVASQQGKVLHRRNVWRNVSHARIQGSGEWWPTLLAARVTDCSLR